MARKVMGGAVTWEGPRLKREAVEGRYLAAKETSFGNGQR